MTTPLFVYMVSPDDGLGARLRKRFLGEIEFCLFSSAEACRVELDKRRPDLVVIDLALPHESGVALHRALREDFDLGDLYQLLLYPAGSLLVEGVSPDDFLLAPFCDDAFALRLALIKKLFAERATARDQMAYAQNVAFTSMSAMGELGVVMQFLSRSFACANIQSVADLAVDSLRQYELEGAVYVVWEGEQYAPTTSGEELSPEQRNLIVERRTLGRILQIERNLVVNFDHVTVLVTNLPEDDLQRVGRIRDNIATLAEGVESRVLGLLLEHDNLLKRQGIRYATVEIRDSVVNLHARQQADLMHTRELVSQVIDEFESTFVHMGLHSEHENQLIGSLMELRRKLGDIVGLPGEVHEKLKIVIAALETLAGQS